MYDYVGDNPCTYNGELEIGTEYVNGQNTYKYRQEWNYDQNHDVSKWINTLDDGWGVKLTDAESTDSVITPLCTSVNNKPIVSLSWLFFESNANSIDLSSFDNQNVKSMSGMFAKNKTNNLDFDNFDTSNVTSMHWMFRGSKVTVLDLSSFDMSNVTNMEGMFQNATARTGYARTQADADKFNTSSNKPSGLTFVVKSS